MSAAANPIRQHNKISEADKWECSKLAYALHNIPVSGLLNIFKILLASVDHGPERRRLQYLPENEEPTDGNDGHNILDSLDVGYEIYQCLHDCVSFLCFQF
jgi:hypothetical protein